MAAPTERVFVAQPFPTAGSRVIASPFQFWSTGEDNLRVVSVNALAGVTLKIQGRFIDAAGVIGAASWDHTPASDRTVRSSEFPLGVGAVLNLVVYAGGATPKIGQTFVIVQLIRGTGAAAIVLGTLLQGYVTSTQALAWPGSPLENSVAGEPTVRHIVGTTPAAGVELSETVPTGARWEVLTFRVALATSATVATRRAFLTIAHAGVGSMQYNPAGTQAASQNFSYEWAANMPVLYDGGNGICNQPLPARLMLQGGDSVHTVTTSLQAGDQFNSIWYSVREWLEVQ